MSDRGWFNLSEADRLEYRRGALGVRCPRCGVGAGFLCVTHTGADVPKSDAHDERKDIAKVRRRDIERRARNV